MHDAHALLQTLAIVLLVAAVTTVVFQRLHQPVVFGYLLAGVIAGPYVPIPIVADRDTVQTLSELGVILLMFSLGLEFSIRRLIQVGPSAAAVAVTETSLMMWLGYTVGQLLGFTRLESVYAGAIVAISSTTIIVKAFEEQRARGRFTELVLSVLIMEDLIAILLLAVLTTLSAGSALTAQSVGITGARLASFLGILIVVGLLVVPRAVRLVVRMNRPETSLIVAVGICFGVALLASSFGYSVALGAFIAGSLVAESGEERTIEHLVRPVRDIFAAIFFVAVGMMINPALVAEHWKAVLLFTLLVMGGKVIAVSTASFFAGYGARTAVQGGMSMAQIGEFSFILAGVGLATNATRDFLYPVAVTVSAITTLTTPWLIRGATPVAKWVDRKLPHPLQTFASLYGSWIERLRAAPSEPSRRSRTRKLIGLLLLDAVLLGAVVIGASLEMGRLTRLMRDWIGAPEAVARLIVLAGALGIGIPLVIGLVRVARTLGLELALRVMPAVAEGRVDIADAPRRALVVTLQLAIILMVGVPLMTITHPFVPYYRVEVGFALLLIGFGVGFWRSATSLYGHARAGAEVIAAALGRQMGNDDHQRGEMEGTMQQVKDMLPGLGEPTPLRIRPDSPAAGKTLAALNLRGLTGATVLAIMRPGAQVLAPLGREVVQENDVLAVTGSQEAVDAARELLRPPSADA